MESLVDAAHAEIKEPEAQKVLAALTEEAAPDVNAAVEAAGKELLLIVARLNAASQVAANQACNELPADKRNAQHRIANRASMLSEERKDQKVLKNERDEATTELKALKAELCRTNSELERLRQESSGVDRLAAELWKPGVREDIC